MNIAIVAIGKIKENFIKQGINEYIKRIHPYAEIKIVELKESSNELDINSCIKEESKKIENYIFENKAFNILLDLKGISYSSEDFSKKIGQLTLNGISKFNFIIGGSYGVSNELKDLVDMRLKFSDFTFPHQLIRLFLIEQIYRWLSILNNLKYHK